MRIKSCSNKTKLLIKSNVDVRSNDATSAWICRICDKFSSHKSKILKCCAGLTNFCRLSLTYKKFLLRMSQSIITNFVKSDVRCSLVDAII